MATKEAVARLNEACELCQVLVDTRSDELHERMETFERIQDHMNWLERRIGKFRGFLAEPDPDRRIYGPAMCKRFAEMIEKFDVLSEVYEESVQPTFRQQWDILQHRKLLQEERIKHQLAETASARYAEQLEEAKADEELRQRRAAAVEEERRKEAAVKREREMQEKKKREKEEALRLQTIQNYEADVAEISLVGWQAWLGSAFLKEAATLDSLSHANLEFRKRIEASHSILWRIIREPFAPHFRVLRLNNPQFQEDVGDFPACMAILITAGFVLREGRQIKELLRDAKVSYSDLWDDDALLKRQFGDLELFWVLAPPLPENEESAMRQPKAVYAYVTAVCAFLRDRSAEAPSRALRLFLHERP